VLARSTLPIWRRPTEAARLLTAANTAVFLVSFVILLTSRLIPTLAIYDDGKLDHWASGHRDLTVSDRTGDPAWHTAIQEGVAAWAGAGADLRLTLVVQSGRCQQKRDTIEICGRSNAEISKQRIPGEEGFIDPRVGSDHHFHSVDIAVCSDCDIEQDRRVIIATHEIGHALGVTHSHHIFSVMSPSGGPDGPDAQDFELLRSKHAHVD